MMKEFNIKKDLPGYYFWDVDPDKLDAEKSKRLIIERIFSLGTLKEINAIIEFYGRKDVIHVLENLNYLDPKTLNFVSKLFNRPLNHFKCYTRKQLKP
jgi:hypothetical protein